MITKKPTKNNKAFSKLLKESPKWTIKVATNIVAAGKKLKNLVLYPTIIKKGAINSEKTASIKVGASPIPIGFEKLKFPSINLLNLLSPWPYIIDPEKTTLKINNAILFI